MIGFIIRRLLWAIPVVLFATLLTFLLVKSLPFEESAFSSNPKLTDEQVETLERTYGLDKPAHEQFVVFLRDLVSGDLGVSTKSVAQPIADIVKEGLPTSALLGALSFIFAALLGTALGIVSAVKVNRIPDYAITLLGTLAFALPSFVIATIWVEYLPYYGWETWAERLGPIIVLGMSIMPYFIRLIRASMLEVLEQEYIVSARAKGLPWRTTLFRHTLRNSLIPTIVNAGPLLGFVLTGSFIIEHIMSVPGIASAFVDSFSSPIDNRLILVTTVMLSTIIILMNLIVDVMVAWLDPRIVND